MEIITLNTKAQNSEVMDKRATQCCFPDLFSVCCFILQRKISLKLHGCVVLFQTDQFYPFPDRRSLLIVTYRDDKHKIVTLRIEKHIKAGTNARLTGC